MADNAPVPTGDYVERYANNVTFDMQGTDIKILFGTVSKHAGQVQHTGITLAWAEAKLFHYFLGQNIAIYEAVNNEPIQIPKALMPKAPSPPTSEQIEKSGSEAFTVFEAMKRRYEAFMAGHF